MQGIASRLGLRITFTRTLGTFLEVLVTSAGGQRVEFDLALDSPYRLEPIRRDPELKAFFLARAMEVMDRAESSQGMKS
ncbi:MAG: hypothetical protein ACP5JJ_18750 [Anaerolineae bacterium]